MLAFAPIIPCTHTMLHYAHAMHPHVWLPKHQVLSSKRHISHGALPCSPSLLTMVSENGNACVEQACVQASRDSGDYKTLIQLLCWSTCMHVQTCAALFCASGRSVLHLYARTIRNKWQRNSGYAAKSSVCTKGSVKETACGAVTSASPLHGLLGCMAAC